jgi:hypothetical protein
VVGTQRWQKTTVSNNSIAATLVHSLRGANISSHLFSEVANSLSNTFRSRA